MCVCVCVHMAERAWEAHTATFVPVLGVCARVRYGCVHGYAVRIRLSEHCRGCCKGYTGKVGSDGATALDVTFRQDHALAYVM